MSSINWVGNKKEALQNLKNNKTKTRTKFAKIESVQELNWKIYILTSPSRPNCIYVSNTNKSIN